MSETNEMSDLRAKFLDGLSQAAVWSFAYGFDDSNDEPSGDQEAYEAGQRTWELVKKELVANER